MLEMSN